jgi:acyl-CoA synthetase (AMP-forming)/AMP-acid ligase II
VPPGGVEKTTSGKLARRATRARYADRLEGA